jgi:hypothetical protein
MTTLEQINRAIHSATAAKDSQTRGLYAAIARSLIIELRAAVDRADKHLTAIEVELGRRSRDVVQLPLHERETT